MIELLRDAEGRPWFMELNGRAWGSMALARRRGFEYPAWTVQAALDPDFVPVAPVDPPDILARHLGMELAHVAFVLRGPQSKALTKWPKLWPTLRAMARPSRRNRLYNWRASEPDAWPPTRGASSASLHGAPQGLGREDDSRCFARPLRVVLDADWPLAELADAFQAAQVRRVLTAEHDRGFDGARWDAYRQACADASVPGLLFVPGIEYEDAESLVHVPVWGSGELPFLGAARPTTDCSETPRRTTDSRSSRTRHGETQ